VTQTLEQWFREPAAPGRLPRWAAWYVQRYGSGRIVPRDWTDGQRQEARRVACAIAREHGISPHAKTHRRLASDELRRVVEQAPEPIEVEEPQITDEPDGSRVVELSGQIRSLEDLLDAAGVDPSAWYVGNVRVNAWGSGAHQNYQAKATLTPRLDQYIRPAQIENVPPPPPSRAEHPVTLLIPDSQNGYRRTGRYGHTLEPMHDRRAWDCCVQLAEELRPDRIVLLGDMVDNAEGSKRWPIGRELLNTLQPTIDELAWWIAQLRVACPEAEIVYIEGNHEDRIDRAIVQYVRELQDIRPAGDDEALITWRRLLRLDDLGVRYVGPYGERIRVYPDAYVEHGTKHATGGGATGDRYLAKATASVYVGHCHSRFLTVRTLHDGDERRKIECGSPGTIARIDGAVPAVSRRVDWQQGAMILTHRRGQTTGELCPIDNGALRWRGQEIVWRDRRGELAAVHPALG